jgi:hypothetical protein
MRDGASARLFWRALDALDYWVMQARLWMLDTLHGPEPETEADRQRGCDREDLARRLSLDRSPRVASVALGR